MVEAFEFKDVDLGNPSSREQQLRQLGEEGWELIKLGSSRSFSFRRAPARSIWEYRFFDLYGIETLAMGRHLTSCGWVLYEASASSMYERPLSVGKRPGNWRGSDDGDILARLRDLGHDPGYMDRKTIVSQILHIKWLESQQQGHNIGTYQAVLLWLAQRRPKS